MPSKPKRFEENPNRVNNQRPPGDIYAVQLSKERTTSFSGIRKESLNAIEFLFVGAGGTAVGTGDRTRKADKGGWGVKATLRKMAGEWLGDTWKTLWWCCWFRADMVDSAFF